MTITLTQLGYGVGAGSKPGVPASIPQSVSRFSRIAGPAEAGTPARAPGTLRISSPAHHSMDVHGNEVSSAVATYQLDATGLVYEEHSPQTEVPRLAEPTS